MPLELITGPANAAKAGAVLERLRAALARDPVLVVPTPADAQRYQRELAAAGVVLGAEVVTFNRLVRAIAAATGVRARALGRVARDRVVRAAVADVRLRVLAESSAAPGFAAAVGALFAELGRSLVTPQRFTSALRTWEATGEAPTHAGELAALFAAYHRRLEALGVVDWEGLARAALDALRERPAAWGERPVFLYGFDDLTPLQRDAVETLARHTAVCVALPYEPGRAAFAGRAATVLALEPLADRHDVLADRSEHYTPAARGALHHLERRLFEPGAGRVSPNGAVRLLEAGGERAEAELVAASVLELMAGGVLADDIAVLVRGGAEGAEMLGQVLETYGVPAALDRRTPLSRTRLGAGVLAAARSVLPGGTAADLLTWLRTPGRLADPDLADTLEARVRRAEVRTATHARRMLADGAAPPDDPGVAAPPPGGPGAAAAPPGGSGAPDGTGAAAALAALEAIAGAAEAGPEAFLDALVAEADSIWTAPHRRAATVLDPEQAAAARAAAALRGAAAELRSLAAADPALAGGPVELIEALASVPVREPLAEGSVLVADPHAIRARRFRAVFVCGLQEGVFPRHPVPEPFLDDAARASLARATGLVLRRYEDVLAGERYLFYSAVSRPEEVLFLSFRSSDEEGDPLQPSAFVDDVRALFSEELWERRGRRLLAEVTWPPREAPTPHELRRARAAAEDRPDPPPLGPPATAPVLAALAARETEAARGLETFAGCGVRWLVESVLRPQRTEPDPAPMRRGSLAHAVLERTLRRLRDREGSGRLAPSSLPAALEELEAAMADLRATAGGAHARAALRELEVDLRRLLRHEAECGPGLEPRWLEWSFGGDGDTHGPLELPGAGLGVTGRVDRIDVDPGGRAVVRDYKGRVVSGGARWAQDRRLQAGLYALAVRELLGLEPAAALYQPIGHRDTRPRGLVRDDVPGRYVNGDVVDDDAFEAGLDAARAAAARAAADMRAGRIRACPDSCSPKGCAYPGICRASEGALPVAPNGNGGAVTGAPNGNGGARNGNGAA